jgi:WD40 repeat protein
MDSGASIHCTVQSCIGADSIENRTPFNSSTSSSDRFWFRWNNRLYRCTWKSGCRVLPGPVQHNFNLNALSPDGARWAIGGWNANSKGGEVSLCEGGACLPLDVGSRGPSSWIGGIAFDPAGSLLAVGTGDGQVLFFNGRSGVRLRPAIAAILGVLPHSVLAEMVR